MEEVAPLWMLNSKLFIGPHIAPEMIIIVQIPTVLPAIHIMNWFEAEHHGQASESVSMGAVHARKGSAERW